MGLAAEPDIHQDGHHDDDTFHEILAVARHADKDHEVVNDSEN